MLWINVACLWRVNTLVGRNIIPGFHHSSSLRSVQEESGGRLGSFLAVCQILSRGWIIMKSSALVSRHSHLSIWQILKRLFFLFYGLLLPLTCKNYEHDAVDHATTSVIGSDLKTAWVIFSTHCQLIGVNIWKLQGSSHDPELGVLPTVCGGWNDLVALKYQYWCNYLWFPLFGDFSSNLGLQA